jgi:hypothetical protein
LRPQSDRGPRTRRRNPREPMRIRCAGSSATTVRALRDVAARAIHSDGVARCPCSCSLPSCFKSRLCRQCTYCTDSQKITAQLCTYLWNRCAPPTQWHVRQTLENVKGRHGPGALPG